MSGATLNVGDRVKYNDEWLDRLNAGKNERCRNWEGVVVSLKEADGLTLFNVKWDFGTSCHLDFNRLQKIGEGNERSKLVPRKNSRDDKQPGNVTGGAKAVGKGLPKKDKKKDLPPGNKNTRPEPKPILRRNGRQLRKEAA